jgi:ribokinase
MRDDMIDRVPRIVVVGSANVDMIVRVPRLPARGETVLGDAFRTTPGGKGANQAVAARRAGADVAFVGCLGADALGDDLLRSLRDAGVDVSGVTRVPDAATGVALITVDPGGDNTIAVASGANAVLAPSHVERAAEAIAAADVLLLQLESPLDAVEAALAVAARVGTRAVLNPAPVPAQALDRRLLGAVAALTPNRDEAARLAGVANDDPDAAATALLALGVGAAVVTLGADGALVATPGGRHHLPAFPVRAVDSTGAGDVFSGALAVALAEGRPVLDAARFANAAAALSVTRPGAQPSAPPRDAILELVHRHA